MLIFLSDDELAWCERHARDLVDFYGGEKSQGSGTYKHNKVSGNLVGVKGELAVTRWLQGRFKQVTSNYTSFTDSSRRGDITCNGHVIEVKSIRPRQWSSLRTLRRMVPPRQLEKYVRANAIVVWATADPGGRRVQLKGWNRAREIQAKGKKVKTVCENVWLQHDQDMHTLDSLLEHLK
uniref:Uncharacterized protein n=1 Tax=viral metagenome TaxID=1070528 RepID=A0A6C0BNX8_9ZZZZ